MQIKWIEGVWNYLEKIEIEIPPEPKPRSIFSLGRVEISEADEYCVLQLLKGCLLRCLGRLKESLECLEAILKFQDSILKDTFVIPHALYEIAMVRIKCRDWQVAIDYLNKAKKYKKYDFKRALNFKINSAVEYSQREERAEQKVP